MECLVFVYKTNTNAGSMGCFTIVVMNFVPSFERAEEVFIENVLMKDSLGLCLLFGSVTTMS